MTRPPAPPSSPHSPTKTPKRSCRTDTTTCFLTPAAIFRCRSLTLPPVALLINHFIDGTGLPGGLALDGSNHVFVSYRLGVEGRVGEYDATTGAPINASLITGLSSTFHQVV